MSLSVRKIILVLLPIFFVLVGGAFLFWRLEIFDSTDKENLRSAEEIFSEKETSLLQEELLSKKNEEKTGKQRELPESRIPEAVKPAEESENNKQPEELISPPDTSAIPLFNIFGKASVDPDLFLDGEGSGIESPEFYEASKYEQSLLLISGKSNDVIEIWQYPFRNNEQSSFKTSSLPNGLDIDQAKDWLLVGFSDEEKIVVYKLPGLEKIMTIGEGKFRSGETNMDILTQSGGKRIMYATEKDLVRGFDLENGKETLTFSPQVESIEEVLADNYHQVIYIPEENGVESKMHSGGAVLAYRPDGSLYPNSNNIFGQGLFAGDEEGITLYQCLDEDKEDTGHGFIIVADQSGEGKNGLEFFNRETWKHLGTLTLPGVSMTDGIASTQQYFPEYPLGILAVSNNDTNTALISWEKIFAETGLSCN
jgi:hypothetical protein